jgi:HPr Serine kinase C-terminal domain
VPIQELIGASVEVAPAGFDLTSPTVDRPLPSGVGRLVAEPRRAILHVPGIATFAVEEGRRVRFEPDPDTAPGRISMWLHGTVAALVLAQRGRFALHASVVEVHGRGVAVTGPRCVGKSTTALRLAQRGHPLVTDDVSPLHGGKAVMVHPFDRPVHVFPHTADDLGLDLSEARRLFEEHPKLALPAPTGQPVPLEAIAVLDAQPDAAVRATRVLGAQAHWLVAANIYRVELFRDLWQAEMFEWAAAIAAKVAVYAVTRPVEDWTVDPVADAIERITGTRSAP